MKTLWRPAPQEFYDARPLAKQLPTRLSAVQLAFPVEARLPAPLPPAPGADGAIVATVSARREARYGRGAAGVRGHLVAEFGAALAWRFGLLLLSMDARGLPLKVGRPLLEGADRSVVSRGLGVKDGRQVCATWPVGFVKCAKLSRISVNRYAPCTTAAL